MLLGVREGNPLVRYSMEAAGSPLAGLLLVKGGGCSAGPVLLVVGACAAAGAGESVLCRGDRVESGRPGGGGSFAVEPNHIDLVKIKKVQKTLKPLYLFRKSCGILDSHNKSE